MSIYLRRYVAQLEHHIPWRWTGYVAESIGQTVESVGPIAAVGECCEITDRIGRTHPAEVIGFRGSNVLSMPIESTDGIRYGDTVTALGGYPVAEVGSALVGRVLDAQGRPIDGGCLLSDLRRSRLEGQVRSPLDRVPIRSPLGTGIRVIDGLLTVGR